MQTKDVLEERGKQYGIAWKIASILVTWISLHTGPNEDKQEYQLKEDPPIYTSLYFYPWMEIVGKIVRACWSPDNADHWRDIIGYATLILKDLEGDQNGTV